MVNTSPTPVEGEAMPWKETNPVLERHHFTQDLESGQWTMSELCLRYGISRNTGYKWLKRYRHDGPRGLLDRSRAPRLIPHQTSVEIEDSLWNIVSYDTLLARFDERSATTTGAPSLRKKC